MKPIELVPVRSTEQVIFKEAVGRVLGFVTTTEPIETLSYVESSSYGKVEAVPSRIVIFDRLAILCGQFMWVFYSNGYDRENEGCDK